MKKHTVEELKQLNKEEIIALFMQTQLSLFEKRIAEMEARLFGRKKDGLKYSVNQEAYLKVFLEDGAVPIDNSASERAIRPFCVGRSN